MKTNNILLERLEYLFDLASKSLSTRFSTEDSFFIHYWVKREPFNEFKVASLSFILNLYGVNHPYYINFKQSVDQNKPECVEAGRGIINSIRTEIEKDWLSTFKGLLSAEIFSDFLDMAEYLLEQDYKDAAAVIIGSTLEEHLKQLSRKYNIPVENEKNGKLIPKKADTLNNELVTASVYNLLDKKNVTAWLDLRNKAAHGKYDEYSKEQVENMLRGIMDFLSRNTI